MAKVILKNIVVLQGKSKPGEQNYKGIPVE
jgi:hypothetical protein